MKTPNVILKETARIAIGVFVLVAAMIGVYAVIGRFSMAVLYGGLYTGAIAVLNFFAMGLTVQSIANNAAAESRSEEEMESFKKNMKAKMQLSYSTRTIAMFALVLVGITVLHFDALASILPLIFPRFVITVIGLKPNVKLKGSAKE